jgi:hypothetical protein
LGSFLKITSEALIIGQLFPHGTIHVLIWTKNGLGYMLGDCFTKLIWCEQCRQSGQNFSFSQLFVANGSMTTGSGCLIRVTGLANFRPSGNRLIWAVS